MAYDRGSVVADSRAVLARHARTFDLAGWFLPAERLDDAAVVYAFCRLVDDVVDCGRLAPTAMNQQRWTFVVVRAAATLLLRRGSVQCPTMRRRSRRRRPKT